MKVISNPCELQNIATALLLEGKKIAVVPTMGYLHEGHGSLIKQARKENDIVIVSIFVNPIQFCPGEDLQSYPRDLEKDKAYCEELGADYILAPTPELMYGKNFSTNIHVDKTTKGLCGASRPGHFDGVCTVVMKLFNITRASRAYFGQKDAQQAATIKAMVRDLNIPIEIVTMPIVREESGLAKSSRNTYLSDKEKEDALVLSKAVKMAQNMVKSGEKDTSIIINNVKDFINKVDDAKVEYIVIVDKDTMDEEKIIRDNLMIAMAVRIGSTRLIDNGLL